jgi:ligand-binding sensor domain-containing protein
MRKVVVDNTGTIWAAGQDGGLASLTYETTSSWQLRQDLQTWTVICLAPRPHTGIYAALRDADEHCALCEILSPSTEVHWIKQGGLAIKDVAAMIVDNAGTLWIGNAWGLHSTFKRRPIFCLSLPMGGRKQG